MVGRRWERWGTATSLLSYKRLQNSSTSGSYMFARFTRITFKLCKYTNIKALFSLFSDVDGFFQMILINTWKKKSSQVVTWADQDEQTCVECPSLSFAQHIILVSLRSRYLLTLFSVGLFYLLYCSVFYCRLASSNRWSLYCKYVLSSPASISS